VSKPPRSGYKIGTSTIVAKIHPLLMIVSCYGRHCDCRVALFVFKEEKDRHGVKKEIIALFG